ncbi:hypothetical protein [Allokutzneria sp. NRRL B-24872]|uniref:hypothetical protein n=1 Tax=Allokutzneria sp. NRRL B-24872 TaxID=1137961 RepID=UPI000A364A75|nr:hypothetical protein [Allokutzneria sp. NRRL B-24872]
MLAGLSDIAWYRLDHAYGSAENVPDLLRAAASADGDAALEAIEELYGSVVHQGSVYSSTPFVLPFVFEIVADARSQHRGMLVGLLSVAAEGDHDGSVADVLDGRVDDLLNLLADDDEQVRGLAATTLGRMRGVPPHRMRWDAETSPWVRSLILVAALQQDGTHASAWLSQALREEPVVRVAAAYAIATRGLEWSPEVTAAVVSGCADGDPLESWEWDDNWLSTVVCSVDVGVVPEFLAELARSEHRDVRLACVYAAIDAMNGRRSLPERLVPVLARMLADPDTGIVRGAVSAIRMSGFAARAADELAALIARELDLESPRSTDPRVSALCALIEIGDPRWRGGVRAVRLTAEIANAMVDAAVPVDAELLDATRTAFAGGSGHQDRIALVRLLGSWGTAARAALPEVLSTVDYAGSVAARALAAIAPDSAQVHEALARRRGEVAAAKALHELTGDAEPLLFAAEANLNDHAAIAVLADLGDAAHRLLPRLREALGDDEAIIPVRRARIAAARMYWRLTGETSTVLPTVAGVLAYGDFPAIDAAEFAAELGDRSLVPLLENLVTDDRAAVSAVLSLWRLTGRAEIDPVLRVLADGWPGPSQAVAALVEMRASGTVGVLRELADREERVVRSGVESSIIRADEALRVQLREAVAALSQ